MKNFMKNFKNRKWIYGAVFVVATGLGVSNAGLIADGVATVVCNIIVCE